LKSKGRRSKEAPALAGWECWRCCGWCFAHRRAPDLHLLPKSSCAFPNEQVVNFSNWDGLSTPLLDGGTVTGKERVKAENLIACQLLYFVLPTSPTLRFVVSDKVTRKTPGQKLRVTEACVLPTERIWCEVANLPRLNIEPSSINGEEPAYDIIRAQEEGWAFSRNVE
jgi:hypothetical protein